MRGGDAAALRVLDGLRLILQATSLGGVESLACVPVKTSHVGLSAEQRRRASSRTRSACRSGSRTPTTWSPTSTARSTAARAPSAREVALDRVGGGEVLRAIAALVGPGNRWITGQRIEVSGGLHL